MNTAANAKPREKLASLELGRFLAASYVLLAHVVPDVNAHAAPGAMHLWSWMGVTGGGSAIEYFFVLSGFVMASSHWQDFGHLRAVPRFWWKRARRIYPVYWLALLMPAYYLHAALTPGNTAQLVTLLPGQFPEFLPPAWTLRFEMAFYIMFGLCLLPYIGRPLLVIWVAASLWHWWPANQLAVLHLPQPAALSWLGAHGGLHFLSFLEYFFFTGLAAGWIFAVFRPGRTLSIGITLAGIAMAIWLGPHMDFGGLHPTIPVLLEVAIALAVIMLGIAGLERHGVLRLPRAATWAGTISYPLYILHAGLLMVFYQSVRPFQLGSAGVLLLFFGQLIAIYGITALVAFLFDQPLQRLLRRWDGGTRRAPMVPEAA